jgi:hypothetical protein
MSEAQAERAISHLYENEGLRGELTDDEATLLLEWGEAQTVALAARDLDDETFNAHFGNLTRLIAHMNRFIGKREGMPADAQRSVLSEMLVLAQALHYKVAPAELEAFQQRALPNLEAIRVLTEMMNASTPSI